MAGDAETTGRDAALVDDDANHIKITTTMTTAAMATATLM